MVKMLKVWPLLAFLYAPQLLPAHGLASGQLSAPEMNASNYMAESIHNHEINGAGNTSLSIKSPHAPLSDLTTLPTPSENPPTRTRTRRSRYLHCPELLKKAVEINKLIGPEPEAGEMVKFKIGYCTGSYVVPPEGGVGNSLDILDDVFPCSKFRTLEKSLWTMENWGEIINKPYMIFTAQLGECTTQGVPSPAYFTFTPDDSGGVFPYVPSCKQGGPC